MKEEIKQLRHLIATLENSAIPLENMDRRRAYWKKAYIEECKKQEEWVEEHLKLVKRLLKVSPKEEGSLESFLFKLYKQFEQLEKQAKSLCDMSPIDLYKHIRKEE